MAEEEQVDLEATDVDTPDDQASDFPSDAPSEEGDPFDFDEPEDILDLDNPGLDESEPSKAAEAATEEEVDPDLLARATELGFDDDALVGLSSKALQQAIAIASKAGSSDVTTDAVDETEDLLSLDLDAEYQDPDIVKAMGVLVDEVNRLRSVVGGLEGQATLAKSEQNAERFDKSVAELGYAELGTGRTEDLGPRTKAAKNRALLKDEVLALRAGYEATGKTVPTESQLLERAARGLFGEQTPKDTPEEAVRNRQGQFIARTGRRVAAAKAKTAEQRAALAVAEVMDSHGMLDVSIPDDEF